MKKNQILLSSYFVMLVFTTIGISLFLLLILSLNHKLTRKNQSLYSFRKTSSWIIMLVIQQKNWCGQDKQIIQSGKQSKINLLREDWRVQTLLIIISNYSSQMLSLDYITFSIYTYFRELNVVIYTYLTKSISDLDVAVINFSSEPTVIFSVFSQVICQIKVKTCSNYLENPLCHHT